AARVNDRCISVEYAPVLGRRVKANELLKDVFSNIVGNSVKHSRPGEPLMITVRVSTTDRWHEVSIEDNGPGIPDSRKGEIFDRLSQGKMRALRTGLGLGLVKTLVESFNGHITVQDRIEGDHTRGCRFVVLLPDAARSPGTQK
ncbi:MAG TPA: sensor histidine kinase, partial [Methanocella sp.]|nr:sensor histidine kinase [Methanocella sp.]